MRNLVYPGKNIMIIGYSIIAVPTGILSAEVGASSVRRKFSRTCPACGSNDHDPDASHCKHCGQLLQDRPAQHLTRD